jgi:GT2 family glycosyltransferase
MSKQILVMGMHRSGTSMVSRILNLMGCYYSSEDQVMLPAEDNPKGFWERKDVLDLNNKILHDHHATWDNPYKLKDIKINNLLYSNEIKNIIFKLEPHRPWFIKDPRFCLTYNCWANELEHNLNIVVLRNPLAVSISLFNRNKISYLSGLALWDFYTDRLIKNLDKKKTILCFYDDFLQDPYKASKNLFNSLKKAKLKKINKPIKEEVVNFVDKQLNRSKLNSNINLFDKDVIDFYTDKYNRIKTFNSNFSTISQSFINTEQQAKTITTLNQTLSSKDQEIHNLNSTLTQRTEETEQQAKTITTLIQSLTNKDQEIDLISRLNHENYNKYQNLLKSNSFKITKPLRWFGRLIRGEFKLVLDPFNKYTKTITTLIQSLTTKDEKIHNLSSSLSQRTEETEQQAKEQEIANLTQVTQAKELEINSILNSICWKITSPLRLVGMFYRWIFARVKMFLHIFKAKISFIKSIIRIHSNSVDNIKALQDLTRRRFNQNKFEKSCGSENPEITISVVTYNSSKWIKPFINSLLKQHYPLEKIHLRFVDSGSSDSTIDELTYRLEENRERFASIKILQQENLGYGAGNDLVLSQALTKLCLVTNVDIEFEVDSILNIVSEALPNLHNKIASWELRQIPYEHPKYYDPVTLETNWSSHACVLISVDAYKEVGGYDQKIFMYCDDVELSYRFRSYGYCLKYVPSAVVIHNTYDEELNIKPLQFTGSILGNCYIRLRYGKWSDLYMGLILYLYHLIKPGPFPGANRLLLLNLPKLFLNTKHFLKGKGPQKAYFPIRYFDYEMIREGAYYELKTLRKKFIVKKNLPKISVITRTYKGRSVLLQQAMQTVFNQTYKNIELIVTEDGGSTQKYIVEKFSLKAPSGISVKYLSNEKIGRSGAGNTALAKASGEYLMFLDDDDLLFADHIETLVSTLISDKSLSAAYSLAFEVQTSFDAGKSKYIERSFITNANHRQHWDYSTLQKYNFIPIQAIIFKRELYDRLGGFDEELDYLEDWNLWLRYGLGNKFFFVNKTTSLYRTPFDISIRMQRNELLKNAILPAKQKAN